MQKLGFPQEWMNELKSKNDIVSVVSRYLPLKQKGKHFWGCCPFHIEKTPSFSVNFEEGLFHCFGCHEGGDAISFVQKIEQVDFPKAVELLASWANMQVPNLEGGEDVVLRAKKKEKALTILEQTKQFFIANLDKPQAKQAREYIAKRALSPADLTKFEIGVSLDWGSLITHLKSKGHTIEEMKEAGVAEIKDGHAYDVMAERLTFPIINSLGETIAFSARILVPADFAKYKNTADTVAFKKSRAVYGIHLIKKLKREKGLNYVVVVEGQMDVIAMHQAGFENTVACMGTALTTEHAREIKKFCQHVVLCMDGDSAGKKAAMSSIDTLKAEGLNVKVARLSEGGKDPDELIQSRGVAAMQQVLDQALPATDYKIVSLSQEFDLTEPSENAKFVSKAMEIVKSLQSNAEKDIYLGLVNNLSKVPIDILRRDLGVNIASNLNAKAPLANKLVMTSDPVAEAVKYVLASNLYKKAFASVTPAFGELLTSNDERVVFDYLMQCKQTDAKPFANVVFDLLGHENEYAKALVGVPFELEQYDEEKHFDACMWIVVEHSLKLKQQELLAQAREQTDPDIRRDIMEKIKKTTQNLMKKNWRDILC